MKAKLSTKQDKCLHYENAIKWIAGNDEPVIVSANEMKDLITVVMIADIFHVKPGKVAKDVIEIRKRG